MAVLNWITNIAAYVVKNINMITGIVSTLVKLIVGILHIWKPEEDNWVDRVEGINQWIQKHLFNACKFLTNLGK